MDEPAVREMLKVYGVSDTVERCERLDAGFSHDVKYVLWVGGAPTYLVRLSASDMLPRRKAEFEALAVHYERGVLCPRPLAFGETPDRTQCFTLLEYLVGESGETALPKLPEQAQYEIGLHAGCELYRMHEVPGEETTEAWLDRFSRKMARYAERAGELGLTYPGRERIDGYIEEHVSLLEQSPVRFQHDDFHPANLILDDGRLVGVIDFNRCDWGDPVEDFYKVPFFGEPVSVLFVNGQIDGYLACEAAADFWARYNLLVAMMLLPSVVWMHFHPPSGGLAWWLDRVAHMIDTHDFEGSGPPTWFKPEAY